MVPSLRWGAIRCGKYAASTLRYGYVRFDTMGTMKYGAIQRGTLEWCDTVQ